MSGRDGHDGAVVERVVVQYDERRGLITGFAQHLADGTVRTLNVERTSTGRPLALG